MRLVRSSLSGGFPTELASSSIESLQRWFRWPVGLSQPAFLSLRRQRPSEIRFLFSVRSASHSPPTVSILSCSTKSLFRLFRQQNTFQIVAIVHQKNWSDRSGWPMKPTPVPASQDLPCDRLCFPSSSPVRIESATSDRVLLACRERFFSFPVHPPVHGYLPSDRKAKQYPIDRRCHCEETPDGFRD